MADKDQRVKTVPLSSRSRGSGHRGSKLDEGFSAQGV